jgi:hypothetical protein
MLENIYFKIYTMWYVHVMKRGELEIDWTYAFKGILKARFKYFLWRSWKKNTLNTTRGSNHSDRHFRHLCFIFCIPPTSVHLVAFSSFFSRFYLSIFFPSTFISQCQSLSEMPRQQMLPLMSINLRWLSYTFIILVQL